MGVRILGLWSLAKYVANKICSPGFVAPVLLEGFSCSLRFRKMTT